MGPSKEPGPEPLPDADVADAGAAADEGRLRRALCAAPAPPAPAGERAGRRNAAVAELSQRASSQADASPSSRMGGRAHLVPAQGRGASDAVSAPPPWARQRRGQGGPRGPPELAPQGASATGSAQSAAPAVASSSPAWEPSEAPWHGAGGHQRWTSEGVRRRGGKGARRRRAANYHAGLADGTREPRFGRWDRDPAPSRWIGPWGEQDRAERGRHAEESAVSGSRSPPGSRAIAGLL